MALDHKKSIEIMQAESAIVNRNPVEPIRIWLRTAWSELPSLDNHPTKSENAYGTTGEKLSARFSARVFLVYIYI